jgi:hypothetical protein
MGVCLSKDRNTNFEDEKFRRLRTEMVHEYLKNKKEFKTLQMSDNTHDKSNDTTNNFFPTKQDRKSVRRSHRTKEIKQDESISRRNTMPEITKGNTELMPSEIMMGYEPILFDNSHAVIIMLMKPKPSPPIHETSLMPMQADFKVTQHIEIQTEKLDESSLLIKKRAPRFSEIFKPEMLHHDQTMIIDSKRPRFISVMEKNLENVDLYHERSKFLDKSLSEPKQYGEKTHNNPTKGYETLNESHEVDVHKPGFLTLSGKQALNQELINERERFLEISMSVPKQLDISYNKKPTFMKLEEKNQENLVLYDERAKFLEMSITVPEHPDFEDQARIVDDSMRLSVRSSASDMARPGFMTTDEKILENLHLFSERKKFIDTSMSVPQQLEMQDQSKYLTVNRSHAQEKSKIYEDKEAHSVVGDNHSVMGDIQRSRIEDPENKSIAIDINSSQLHSVIEDCKRSVNSGLKSESASSSSSESSEENPLEEVYSIRQTYSSKTEDSEYFLKPQLSSPLEEEGVFDEVEYGYMKFTQELDGYASQAPGPNIANEFSYYETIEQKDLESPIRPSIKIQESPDPKYANPFGRPSTHLFRVHERPIPRELVKKDIEGKLTLDDEVRLSQTGRLSFSPPFSSRRYSPYKSP